MKVSILVPFYQAAPFIERCARSVLEQDYADIEYLFIDDGSTDGGRSILERVIEEYPQHKDSVRFIHNEQNLGLASCRNLAVQACTGVFLFWVDADDWISPVSAIRQLVDKQRETGADVVSVKVLRVLGNQTKDFPITSHSSKKDTILGFLDHSVIWPIWGRLIRTSLYRDHGIQCMDGVNFHEDFQVIPRLFHYADTVADVDSVIYYYFYSNPLSYTVLSEKDVRVRHKRWRQNLLSIRMIQEFFRDKIPEADALCERQAVWHLQEIIRDATRIGDKASLMDAMEDLKHTDRRYSGKSPFSLWSFAHFSPSLCWYIKRIKGRLTDPSFVQ